MLSTAACLILAATASAAGLPKVPTSDNPAPASQLRIKPAEIEFGGDGSHFLGGRSLHAGIDWTSWSVTGASGTGDYWITSLTGENKAYAVTISLTRPTKFHGQLVFSTMTYRFLRPNPDFAQTQVYSVNYLPGNASYDGFYWQ